MMLFYDRHQTLLNKPLRKRKTDKLINVSLKKLHFMYYKWGNNSVKTLLCCSLASIATEIIFVVKMIHHFLSLLPLKAFVMKTYVSLVYMRIIAAYVEM